ncbi:hypothetical protein Tco_0328491 [Tanacetum coccineum]
MGTPIDFSAYVMNHLKIDNLTQEILVGPTFNLLKGSCKIFAELEYHFEECYKVVNDRLDWHNPEGREYPFDLSKPLPLIEPRLLSTTILKGGSSSSKYATSTTRTKAAKYDNIEGIEDMVPTLWSDFPRLNLRDIEDMLILLVQKELSNLDMDDRYDLGVALKMFTRRIVILHRVKDLQLGVESHHKKLNITRPETTRSNISKLTPYTAYKTLKESFIKTSTKEIEHQSDMKVIHNDDGNPSRANIKQALGRSILTDLKEYIKMDMGVPGSFRLTRFIARCSYSTDIYKDIMKAQLKNIKKDGYTYFQYQEQYEHVGPEVTRSQEGKRSQDDDKRLCLVNDFNKAKDHIHIKMVVKEIEDGLLEKMEKFGWWFEQDIGGESEDDREKKLVMVNEEGWMS